MHCLALIWLAAVQAPQAPPRHADDVVVQEKKESATQPSPEEARKVIQSTPGGANLLEATEYRKGRVANLEDLFDYTPGVFAASRFGYEETRISIRGSGLQRTFHGRGIQVLQDGIPINLADGSFDMQQIEPLAARYVEVYRGANALQYGGATLGGSINFVSPTGRSSSPILARGEAGSFGYLRGQLASGMAFGDVDYYASLTGMEANGFRDHSEQANLRLFTNFGWQISPELENRFYATYVHTNSDLPGSLTKAQMIDDPTQADPNNVTNDWERNFDFLRVADKITWTMGESRLDASFGYTSKHLEHPIFVFIDQMTDDYVLNASWTDEAAWFGRKNRFIAGILPAYGLSRDRRWFNAGGEHGAPLADGDYAVTSLQAYAEEQHYVSANLAVVLGVQAIWEQMEITGDAVTFPPGATGNGGTHDFASINPKLGARYELDEQTQVYGNLSRSFEPPSFAEVANNLNADSAFPKAQRAWTFELGSRGAAGIFSWDVAAYYAWLQDELVAFQVAPGQTLTTNTDHSVHRGLELGLDARLYESEPLDPQAPAPSRSTLTLRQNYLLNDFRFRDDPVYGNNRIAGVPVHVYRAELRYDCSCGFFAAPNVEWSPFDSFVDHANTFETSAYAAFGFRAGFRWKNLSFFFDARNLTNRVYDATASVVANSNGADTNRIFNPADGRSFYGGVEVSW